MNSIVNKNFSLQKTTALTAKKKTITSKVVQTNRQKSSQKGAANGRKKSVKMHRFKNKKPL